MNAALRIAAVVVLSAALTGCGRSKDTSEPPAELTDFDATIQIDKLWSSKVGGKSERLRLGLRPATDGARIFAGSYDGQVASFDAVTGDKTWTVKTGLPLTAGPGFGEGLLVFGMAISSPLMPRQGKSAGASPSAARFSRRPRSAPASSPCAPSMGACEASPR
jgi:outer membrane protein assembly factor BamB